MLEGSGSPVTNVLSSEPPTMVIGLNCTLLSPLIILTPKLPFESNENNDGDNWCAGVSGRGIINSAVIPSGI